jgi:hypothetical protein
MDWQQAAGQGALRETANLGIGAARLAGQVLPGSVRKTLGQAAQSIPGVSRLQEFADAPAEGPAEYLGSGAVDLATGGAMPAFRLGDAAAAMLPKATPIFAGGGRGFRAIANPTAAKIARYGGDVGETAAKGALGGAVANPDDPMTGAMAGGGAALGGRALGAGLRTHTGQEIGGALSRYGIPTGVGYAVGGLPGAAAGGGLGAIANQVGGAARHTAHRYYSPLGQRLDRFGRAVFDSTGRFLGYMPATAGIAAGRASGGGVQRGRETMYPPTYPHEESEPNAEPGPAQRQ